MFFVVDFFIVIYYNEFCNGRKQGCYYYVIMYIGFG